jgi:hypothetical protein
VAETLGIPMLFQRLASHNCQNAEITPGRNLRSSPASWTHLL